MTTTIKFTKMHGAGNDYIYVNTLLYNIPDPETAAIEWSAPHTGIGSDGLVLIGKPTTGEADYSMRIFNADGSEAMMCGNASRCIGKYLYEKGVTDKTKIRLETLSGIKILDLHIKDGIVDSVTVDMLEPQLSNKEQLAVNDGSITDGVIEAGGKEFKGTFVSMGNPHFVIFVKDIRKTDVAVDGKLMEMNKAFPQRCNIEFAQVLEDGNIRTRVWERGSGITMACGTGACATAVAAALTKRAGRKSNIVMDGGTLNIEWREKDNHVYMTGPAAFSFEGEIKLPEGNKR
jgi:diaminopimelate epimerase